MLVEGLREFFFEATSTAKAATLKMGKSTNGKRDSSTLAIIFMAFVCAVLPLDISQLAFAILGAVLYALLQKPDQFTSKKQDTSVISGSKHSHATARAPKTQAFDTRPVSVAGANAKPVVAPSVTLETRTTSIQPIVAPTFQSKAWEGEVQELLGQITPTPEVEQIVNRLAQIVLHIIQKVVPEIEVNGYANGNFTSGKAFGVAVPDVDIIASVRPDVLFDRLHGRNSQGGSSQLDVKKLQKCAIRSCIDRLVASGGFKFRRSSFRGREPKVTLLVPASLGLFSESIPIDFSVNVVTPLYNAALLSECGKIDARAKELILIVKRWAKDRGICHAAKGHLSPYVWGLLTMYFLQVGVDDEGPLLPPLEQFQSSSRLLPRGTANTLKQPKWKPRQINGSKKSVGDLFKELVQFFETQFDWRNEAVSIRSAQRAPAGVDLPLHVIVSDKSSESSVGPSIEDPFHAAENLGDCMTALSVARLKEEFSRANTLCQRNASLSELLEPWVPADFEAGEANLEEEHSKDSKEADQSALACKGVPRKPREDVLGKGENWRRDAQEAQASAVRSSTPPWRRPAAA